MSLMKSKQAAEEVQALDVVKQLRVINGAALEILREARGAKDHELALKAIDRLHRQVELQAKLLGELAPEGSVTVNLYASSDWLRTREALMTTLAAYPEALYAVADRLAALEAGQ